ncbi:hypothetical protein RYX36_012626, partial [Vicia faba]
ANICLAKLISFSHKVNPNNEETEVMTESHNLETLTKKPSFQLNSVSVESVDHNSFCRPQFATLTALASCHLLCRSIIQIDGRLQAFGEK